MMICKCNRCGLVCKLPTYLAGSNLKCYKCKMGTLAFSNPRIKNRRGKLHDGVNPKRVLAIISNAQKFEKSAKYVSQITQMNYRKINQVLDYLAFNGFLTKIFNSRREGFYELTIKGMDYLQDKIPLKA